MKNVCRLCLKTAPNLEPLSDNAELIYRIETIAPVQILFSDELPSGICEECVQNVQKLYDFRETILNSDLKLQEVDTVHDDTNSPESVSIEETDCEFIKEEKPISVDRCDTVTVDSSEEDLIKEFDEELTEIVSTPQNNSYTCKKCGFSNNHKAIYLKHKCSKHNDYAMGICNICGKMIRKYNLARHVKKHTSSYICSQCGEKFTSYDRLRKHVYEHKGNALPCSICGKIFYYHGDLNKHEKGHVRVKIKEMVPCSVCNKSFEKRSLIKHMRKHTGERPYPCEYCKKGFSSPYALKTHVRQHTNEKPFACETCPAAFHQRVSLVTHMKSKHGISIKKEDGRYVL